MLRYCPAILALSFVLAAGAHAQEDSLCRSVTHHLWSDVATAPLHDQTPLAALVAAAPGTFQIGGRGLTKPDQSIEDALVQDHAANPELAAKLHDLPPRDAVRFGHTDNWLLDRVDGTLGCHTAITVVVPQAGAAHEIALPGNTDATALCALSALTPVTIDGAPALWIEQSGAFSNASDQSTVSLAGLNDSGFEPPCTMVVAYAVTDRASHAFCDGIDCVPLIRTAEILAMRLRTEETAETLGAGAIGPRDNAADYRRMAEIMAADKQPADLPTFGVSLDTPYTTFADQVTFPIRFANGTIYLAQMGHGGFGWRQTADTLLALYRLREDRLVPAAGIYIDVRRTGIESVTIQ